jgi:FAD/FMN-containing dehydrogenase
MDGLFSQGNLGLVTRITLALAPHPECIAALLFGIEQDSWLEGAVICVRDLLRENGALMGNLNLMNRSRMEAMASGPSSNRQAAALTGGTALPAWTGATAIYGSTTVVNAVAAQSRQRLRRAVAWVRVVKPARVQWLHALLDRLPYGMLSGMRDRISRLLPVLQILSGVPSNVALRLAYAAGASMPDSLPPDPARDGCGLIWYSPLVPMKPERVRRYVQMVERITACYGLQAPITLTALSDRCFASTVPLLFERSDWERGRAAEKCYRVLFHDGCEEGFVPYRTGAQHMDLAIRENSSFWQLVGAIKAIVDPAEILAPGRYAPLSNLAGYAPDLHYAVPDAE